MPRPLGQIVNFESFRSQASEWRRFAKIIVPLILLPIGLILGLSEFLCWQTGETMSDQTAALRQMEDPAVQWAAHRVTDSVRFKLIRVAQERPEILMMGQSRGSQFRSAMFKPYSFYNASRISMTMSSLPDILRRLPAGYAPRVIVFNLDFFLFNPRFDPFYARTPPIYSSPAWKTHLLSVHDASVTLCSRPWVFFPATTFPTIGMNARIDRCGFRQDGSAPIEIEGKGPGGSNPYLLQAAHWNGTPSLYFGDAMGPRQEAGLEEFCALAKARGITLIGVQVPMYGPVVRIMESNPHFGILRDFEAHAANGYFDRLGIIFLDYLKLEPYADDYRNFADVLHPTENVVAAVVKKMAEDPRVEAVLPDLNSSPSKSSPAVTDGK